MFANTGIHLNLSFDSDIFGLRVVNVYDVDNKTYLIKLSRLEMSVSLSLLYV